MLHTPQGSETTWNAAAAKVVIFDCDGVMFDTQQANRAYYNGILRHLGRPELTPAQFAYCQMHTVGECITHLFPTESDRQAAHEFRLQTGYLPFIPLMRMEPDLPPLLARLRPGRGTAIATNRTDTMGRVLEVHGLTDRFDLVVSAMDVPRPKPHPDQLLKIQHHFGIGPQEAIYIGDSSVDMEAAQAAGTPFIAFRNRRLKAFFHVDNFRQVGDLLQV